MTRKDLLLLAEVAEERRTSTLCCEFGVLCEEVAVTHWTKVTGNVESVRATKSEAAKLLKISNSGEQPLTENMRPLGSVVEHSLPTPERYYIRRRV